jgi:hypothetical protein
LDLPQTGRDLGGPRPVRAKEHIQSWRRHPPTRPINHRAHGGHGASKVSNPLCVLCDLCGSCFLRPSRRSQSRHVDPSLSLHFPVPGIRWSDPADAATRVGNVRALRSWRRGTNRECPALSGNASRNATAKSFAAIRSPRASRSQNTQSKLRPPLENAGLKHCATALNPAPPS